ncbi:Chymotrypsin-like elastase member 2A [Kickxella alabastrina]|uniref:Chymotrypsin-like elastase member 2A n=1 Tax=Kickxella alabastrina TaxID=61397 RepID=A0ACC1IRI8_9FUNG|nr:Chymotrypsin-like elastase member 2A [Kickxella alabastrina]
MRNVYFCICIYQKHVIFSGFGSDGFAILGIASFRSGGKDMEGICAKACFSGFYARAAKHIDWITKAGELDIKGFTISNKTAHAGAEKSNSELELLDVEEDDQVKPNLDLDPSAASGVKSNSNGSHNSSTAVFGILSDPILSKRNIGRIVGGVQAPADEYNFIAYVNIISTEYGASYCTGSLIAPDVVLTAAHCVYATQTILHTPDQLHVRFTHITPKYPTTIPSHEVVSIIPHPKFVLNDLNDDVALLILANAVSDEVATRVKLYTGDYYLDTPLEAAGFGATDPLNKTKANTLMKVDLQVGSISMCSNYIRGYNREYLICTDGSAGKSTCNGDSGGPLLTPVDNGSAGFALLGLTSFVSSKDNSVSLCASAASAGFYARLTTYAPWIAAVASLNLDSFTITNKTAYVGETDAAFRSKLSGNDENNEVESSSSGAERSKTLSVYIAIFAIFGVAALTVLI